MKILGFLNTVALPDLPRTHVRGHKCACLETRGRAARSIGHSSLAHRPLQFSSFLGVENLIEFADED